MTRGWRTVRMAVVIGLTMAWFCPLVAAAQGRPGSGPNPPGLERDEDGDEEGSEGERSRTMTQAEWQALGQKVSVNLHWIGVQMGANPQELAV